MKYTTDKIKECVGWVEDNGVYPQKCGASVRSFCDAMGIDYKTYENWMKKPLFVEAIRKANQTFAQRSVEKLKNALMEKALGCTRTKSKLTEEGVTNGGRMTTRKAVRITEDVVYPPDTGAAIFVITNLDPENWKNRKLDELEGNINVEKPKIVFRDPQEEDVEE